MLFKVTTSLLLAASALAQTFSVSTPAALPQCQPAQIQITGGTAPYILAAIPAAQPTAPAIATIADRITSAPYVWNVNLPAGLNITLRLTDSLGNIAYSYWVVIQAGASNACLNASASTSGLTTVPVTTTVTTSGTLTAQSLTSAVSRSTTSLSSSASSAATSSMSSMASMSSASASGNAASSVSSAVSRAASTSGSWAMPSAVAGLPALALAAMGGVAAVL